MHCELKVCWVLLFFVVVFFALFFVVVLFSFLTLLTSHIKELSSFVLISLVLMIRPLKGPNFVPFDITVLVQNTP